MKKKEGQNSQDPKELNAAFLLKFAKLTYESKGLNLEMVNVFSNFLQFVGESIQREPQNFTNEIIKAVADIAITVEFNLNLTENFLAFEIEPILKFLQTLFNFADKVFSFEQKPNKDKAVEIIDIFWPLLSNQLQIGKVEAKEFQKISASLQKMPQLPYIYQIQQHQLRMSSEQVISEAIEIAYINERMDFSILFRAALSKYNEKNNIFFESFFSFFEAIMNESVNAQNKVLFEKCLSILMKISNSVQQKYNYLQIFFNRISKSTNFIRNFVFGLSLDKDSSSIGMEKYYSHQNFLGLFLIVIQKIITFRYMNKEMSDALEIIAKFSENWCDLSIEALKQGFDLAKLNSDFVLKIVKFLTIDNKTQGSNSQVSSLSQIFEASSFQMEKGLQNEQLDEKRLFEFIKQCKMRSQSQDGEDDMQINKVLSQKQESPSRHDYQNYRFSKDKNQLQQTIVNIFCTILHNLTLNKDISQRLRLGSVEKLEEILAVCFEGNLDTRTKDSYVIKEVSELLIKCLPSLISQDSMDVLIKKYLFNESECSSNQTLKDEKSLQIIRILIMKRLESVSVFAKIKQEISFQKLIQKILSLSFTEKQNMRNYHFLAFYIYFKKCLLLNEKEEIVQIQSMATFLLDNLYKLIEISSTLDQKDKKDASSIKRKITTLELFLVLILDHPSGSFKINLKKIFSDDIFKIDRNLDFNQLIIINQKESANSFFNSRLKQIINDTKSQNSLGSKFLKYVSKSNEMSFSSQSFSVVKQKQPKQDKNMKIFLNIKMNLMAASLHRTHSIPLIIQNINVMRKTNSIHNLDILLFSFSEYLDQVTKQIKVDEEKSKSKIQESHLVVVFNYFLKINLEAGRFNEKGQEEQSSVQQQINILEGLHESIQEVLQKAQNLLVELNPPFSLNILVKLFLKNIKESSYSLGIAEKYTQYINEGQIIKLISQLTENETKLSMQLSQLTLITMKKLILKDQKIRQRINQMKKVKIQPHQQSKITEQTNKIKQEKQQPKKCMIQLSNKLRQLHLLYYPYKHDLNLCKMLRLKIQTAILQLSDQETEPLQQKISTDSLYQEIIEDLLKNIESLKQIVIKQAEVSQNDESEDMLWNFEYKNKSKFITYIIKSILKLFYNQEAAKNTSNNAISFQLNQKIFTISSELLDNPQICALAQKQIGSEICTELVKMISERIDQGIALIVKAQTQTLSPRKNIKNFKKQSTPNNVTKDFLQTSWKLYNILKKIVNFESFKAEQIITLILQKDTLTKIQVTKFLIEQLLNLSSFIKQKSQALTQQLFTYIIKVNETYSKEQKPQLKIPQFLCQFFNVSNQSESLKSIKNIEKPEKPTSNTCTVNPSYRCLKCDEKRIICYGCMMECHKGHPVVYMSESKFPRCQCRQVVDCKLMKKCDESQKDVRNPPINNIFSYQRKLQQQIGGRPAKHDFFMAEDDRIDQPIHFFEDQEIHQRFGGRMRRPKQWEGQGRENIFRDQSYDRMEGPFGGRMPRQQKKVEQKFNAQENFDFTDENYESTPIEIQSNQQSQTQQQSPIASQSYYLPVFIEMFNDLYSKSEQVSLQRINSQTQKFGFDSLVIGKVMNATWRASNAGSYNVRLRKENQLNNKSPTVSKQVIVQNQKFIIIASGNMLSVHLKQRYFLQLLQGKPSSNFPNIHQHSVTFDIHTIDFSPLDEFSFVVSGLHTIILFQLNGQGLITRTNSRANVSNDYINKVRTSSLGIFYSTSYDIKLLNWSFKQVLTIKSSSDCLLKEWCLYEKKQSCTVYCVTAHGFTEYIDISPNDQGRKMFTNKVNDGRKSIETGATILVKDVQKIGKVYIGSFKDKDGTNLIANLVGDSTQNNCYFTLKNNYLDILGKKFLLGQVQIVKGGENQIFVVCTIREPITPENSIHLGQLVVFKIRRDKKCQFSLINQDNKCEYFSVVPIGESNWSIISLHDDGSLHFSILQKAQKQQIDQECKRLRQIHPVSNDKNSEKYTEIKESIKKQITPQMLSSIELHPLHHFRQFSDLLKTSTDVKVIKKKDDYEITLLNPNKVITGLSLPFLGNVYLPNRTIKNTVELGLSNLQILHYFAQGTLKFRVQKVQDIKSQKDNLNQRFLEKLQRLERFNELALDSERATQLINSIKQTEALSDDIVFFGQGIDTFKNRIPSFSQIFNAQQQSQSKDKQLLKISTILKLFIEDSIQKQNYLCESDEIIQFVKTLRKISVNASHEVYLIVKDLIVSALKMFQNITGDKLHVFNDQYYPLKYATEIKAETSYELLKGQINDSQVQHIVDFFADIIDQDLLLGLLYLSKYPSLLAKIQKKSKKIEKLELSTKLLKLYIVGYQVYKYKNHNCEWILPGICSIFGTHVKSQELRQSFYQNLTKYANLKTEAWIKNIQQIDGQENVSDINIINKVPEPSQQNIAVSQNNMASLYGQFNMGEMDEQAMLRMAIEMSEMQFKQNQQNHLNFNNIVEEEKQNIPEEAMMMENQVSNQELRQTKKHTLLMDLVQHCFKDLSQPGEIAVNKICVLYVLEKYINKVEDTLVFEQILEQIYETIMDLNPNCDNIDKHVLMAYLSIFSNILSTSTILQKKISPEAEQIYEKIKTEVLKRLESVKPEKVTKLKNPPNLLGKIFKGQKLYTFAHYAYGLASLILPPCEPVPILLSLECYWLLPESKEYYKKLKHMTTIREGISTGNIDKIYQVSVEYPQIWRQTADVEWLESWIEEKKNNWEKALGLLALYYDEKQTND